MRETAATVLSKPTPVKRAWVAIVCAFVAALTVAAVAAQPAALFYCPMHPEVTANAPDKCMRCGMALVPGDPYDLREYRLEVDVHPRAPKPGEPIELAFRVR